MLLVGDIGGTKTNLAIFDPRKPLRKPLVEGAFPSAQYTSLGSLAHEFLGKHDISVTRASFGVAGPVVGGRATITNLPWVMDEQQLCKELHLKSVRLLNDLLATAYAVPYLQDKDLHTLNEGRRVPGGSLAVIAPGTGLGEAFLTWEETHYSAHPSEGGHTDFGPNNELETALLHYLSQRLDHVSYEHISSGMGLPNIYAFFKDTGRAEEPDWLAAKLAEADDPTPVIANTALDTSRSCPICQMTLATFVSILGAEVGNLALKVLATGGVYLGGGIPPRILSALEKGNFMKSFLHKGRLSHVLALMPVHVILNPKVGLLGAAHYGLEA